MKKIIISLFIFSSIQFNSYAFGVRFNLFKEPFKATGGVITYTDSAGLNPRSTPPYPGGYVVHTFLSSGTFTVTAGSSSLDYLVVAGGGGGGGAFAFGGGGSGGMRTGSTNSFYKGSYLATVGAGGVGESGIAVTATSGQDSTFSTITSTGGGRGAEDPNAVIVNSIAVGYIADNGGSGGGAGYNTQPNAFGTGIPNQGNNGGSAYVGSALYLGGGGGGAGSVGGNGVSNKAGVGGAGLSSSISGVPTFYAGGGAGGVAGINSSAGMVNIGGSGGGGATATSATTNTGGGGGSGYSFGSQDWGTHWGGNGGSGIIIIRYKLP